MALKVDRPFDLAVLAETAGDDLLCVYNGGAQRPAGWDGGHVSCPVLPTEGHVGLDLALKAPSGWLLLTKETTLLKPRAEEELSQVSEAVSTPALRAALQPH